MKRCVNFREGCQGRTSSYWIHYCNDCCNAWQVGGETQVSEDIASRNKPAHVCVGQDQLAAKDAEIAKLQEQVAGFAAFKAEIVEQYTVRFRGEARLPNPDSLLTRIKMDYRTASAARSAHHRDRGALPPGTPLSLRAEVTCDWLKLLEHRLKLRTASQDNTRRLLEESVLRNDELRRELEMTRGQRCQCPKTGEYVNKSKPFTSKHPSANTGAERPLTGTELQLHRIESFAKQAAQRGPSVSSVFLTFICTVLIGGGIFIW